METEGLDITRQNRRNTGIKRYRKYLVVIGHSEEYDCDIIDDTFYILAKTEKIAKLICSLNKLDYLYLLEVE